MKQTQIQKQAPRRPAQAPEDHRSPSGKIKWAN